MLRAFLTRVSYIVLMLTSSAALACPDGQYEQCTLGICICLPKVGGDVGRIGERAKAAVRDDPLKIVVNPMALINTSGIPTQGDVFEFVIKNPDKVIELLNNPNQWPYVPVAAAMVSARNAVVTSGGRPMPEDVKRDLRRWYPDALLNSVRWTANWGALQNTLQAAQMSFNGQTQAITVINAVVFRDGQLANDRVLWAHEMYHVQQYRQWGVFGFAKAWVDNSSVGGPVEAPAYAREREARQAFGGSLADSYDASTGTYAGNVGRGSGRAGRGGPPTVPSLPPQVNAGLPGGTGLRPCGCWGYAALGMAFPWNQCRSGYAVHQSCNQYCPTGGVAYGTVCGS